MPTKDIIVIGSSAGGVEALQRLCDAARGPAGSGVRHPASLALGGERAAATAQPRRAAARAVPGRRADDRARPYLCRRTRSPLLVRPGRVLVRRGPYENRTRPAVDALFRSAAVHYGGRTIGVVLTGLLDDGTDGLIAIKAAGGLSVVQDPDDAEWPSMPRNALKRDHVDHAVPLAEIGGLLTRLAQEPAKPSVPLPEEYLIEDRIAAQEFAVAEPDIVTPGEPSHLSCPDCGGVLNNIETQDEVRFRCQVGHAFTPLGLAAAQNDELERALAIAVRTHRDRRSTMAHLGQGGSAPC